MLTAKSPANLKPGHALLFFIARLTLHITLHLYFFDGAAVSSTFSLFLSHEIIASLDY